MVVLRCDVTVREDVETAMETVASAESGLPPVRGIVHAACPPQGGGGPEGDTGAESEADRRFLEAKVRCDVV